MQWTEEQMDRTIGALLRTGVGLAATVVLAGGLWYLVRYGGQVPNYHLFRGEPADLRSVGGVMKGVSGWQPRSWIQLGLLLLIATPIARVGFSVVAFAAQHDRTYVAITLLVLTVLVCSFAGLGYPTR